MPIKNYHRPTDWDSARAVLRDSEPLLLGPRVPIPPHGEAASVTDLSLLELNYITADSQIHIGALTPLQALAESTEIGSLLSEAARLTTHYGLRNVATVGGLLLAPEGPSEILLALLVLDATVVIRGDVIREAPIANYALQNGEIITEIKFAQPVGKTVLERVTRTPRDEGIVVVAVLLETAKGVCSTARVALAGASPKPQRVIAAGQILVGQALTPEQITKAAAAVMNEANPIGDYRGSAEYRKAMAGVLVKRALTKVAE